MLKAKKKKLTIKQICAKPAQYVGHVVTLQGIYLGWKLGKCHFPPGAETKPPVTKSDWLMGIGSDCIYVTLPAPGGLRPTNDADIGCRIEITGTVALKDGGVYLVFGKGRLLSKPASTVKSAA